MIIGNHITNQVRVGDHKLDPKAAQALTNYPFPSFRWGNKSMPAAQLALAILLEFTDANFAVEHYQDFKQEHIATKDADHTLVMQEMTVVEWASKRGYSW
jgi:hypothetical protein